MAPIDRRVRLLDWVVRRQGSIGTKSAAEVIAMQSRRTPSNGFFDRIFGSSCPEQRCATGPLAARPGTSRCASTGPPALLRARGR